MIGRGEGGPLRVYLGAAPGVGKTVAMLEEGGRRAQRGTDVVVGWVETHGRERTAAAIGDLEVIPRRAIRYGGTDREELDLGAVLERAPQVVLIDELAHTNVPGSEHEKRWQDVQAIRAAGIEVVTTVNIQHLESLNDVAAQVTGVRQRETVPDRVVRQADQIELVDMSPQALRRRLAHGNVYAADRVDAALAQYFREGNLTALRELALLWLADRVEEGLSRYREQHDIESIWVTRERIVVPVSGGPESATLMRRAARIASRGAGGEWSALYVARRDGLTGVSPGTLADLREQADRLGGSLHTVVSDEPAQGILDFARAENASQVVIGASRRGRVSTLLRPGIGERVVSGAGDIDIHLVTHDYARRGDPRPTVESLSRRRRAVGFAFGLLAPLTASLLLWFSRDLHGLPTEAMVLMVVVVATALIGGLLPAVLAAIASGLLLNVLFTPPLYTLTVAEPENAIAILLFTVVAVAVATVVDNAARRTTQARRARAEADALTVLSHSLLNASDDLTGLLASAGEVFGARGAAVLERSETGTLVLAQHGAAPTDLAAVDQTAEITGGSVLALAGPTLPAERRGLLTAYAAYAKVMLERRAARVAETEKARLAEADRTRTALLAAVSHDLRSPLSAVRAAVDSLRDTTIEWSAQDRTELLDTIHEATERLVALVTNLLDMSRISAGAVTPALTEVSLLEAVRTALAAVPGGERVVVDLDEATAVCADPGLLDRILANIVENGLKHTPTDAHLRVDAVESGSGSESGSESRSVVAVRIVDTGPGVAEDLHDRIFAPFQRFGDVPRGEGVGLGLAVARGFAEAMGGTIAAEPTPGGGLTFVIHLPAAGAGEEEG